MQISTSPGSVMPLIDCGEVHAHRDTACSAVNVQDRNSNPLVSGIEADWLSFFWDITTNPNAPDTIEVDDILTWYESAKSGTPITTQLTAERLIDGAPAPLQSRLLTRATAHAIHAP